MQNYDYIIKLHEYNSKVGSAYQDCIAENRQIPYCSWLDWLILGNVYIVGLGMDYSETDLWWAFERKSRERILVGKTYFYGDKDPSGKIALMNAMHMEYLPRTESTYEEHYDNIIRDIESRIGKRP